MPAGPHTTSAVMTPRGITWLGLVINVGLSGAKILGGLIFSSQAILADGLHSLSDLVSDVAVLAGLRVSERPADGSHPWGHRRVSTMVAMFVGALLLVLGCAIVYNAIVSFRDVHAPMTSLVPLSLALATIPLKEILFHLTRRVGRRVGDVSLVANAWHHRSDAFSSVAAAAGLAVVAIGGQGWSFMDELTALVLSAFLIVAAGQIMWSASSELIDRAPSRAIIDAIESAIRDTIGVRDHHAVRARQIGGKVTMDVHILVDPDLTVRQGHDIASAVQESVRKADGNIVDVNVHVEPWESRQDRNRPAGPA